MELVKAVEEISQYFLDYTKKQFQKEITCLQLSSLWNQWNWKILCWRSRRMIDLWCDRNGRLYWDLNNFKEEIEEYYRKKSKCFLSQISHSNQRRVAYLLKSGAVYNQERRNRAQYFADYSALRESSDGHRNFVSSKNQSKLYLNKNEEMKDGNEKEMKVKNLH